MCMMWCLRLLLLGLTVRTGSFQEESVGNTQATINAIFSSSILSTSSLTPISGPVATSTVHTNKFSSMISTTLAQLQATPTADDAIEMTLVQPQATPTAETMLELRPLSIVAANITDLFISGTLNCACDLLIDGCDTSCCCDQDCTSSELKVFDCTNFQMSSSVCLDVSEGHNILWTSLRRCSCEDEALFCVIREQDPSVFRYAENTPIVDLNQFTSELLIHTVPGDTLAYHGHEQGMFVSFYKLGDPVLIIYNETSLGFLTLPGQLNGLRCHDSNPITYLRDEVRICERQLSPLSLVCESLSTIHNSENIAIAKVPLSVSDVNNESGVIPEIRINCSIAGKFVPCSTTVPTYSNNTCESALLETTYSIVHNGTGQILGVYVDVVLGDVEDSQTSYIQTYTIRFIYKDKETPIYQRSGNPGYTVGQPVLAGSLTDVGIIDISVDSSAWLSVRSSSHQCNIDSSTNVVRFGEDIVTVCVLQLPITAIRDCEVARSRAWKILTPSPQLNYIAIFGDSNPLDISEWVPLINTTAPRNCYDQAGTPCSDFPTFLQIDILYSFVGLQSNPQAVISGVLFTYHTESVYRMLIRSDTVTIPLKTAVTFTDISVPPIAVLNSVDNTVGYLPQDFLYPFFVSHAIVVHAVTVVNILVSVFIILTVILIQSNM